MNIEKKSKQNEIAELKKTIRENFPDFTVYDAVPLGEGWMSRTILVNNEWVFRFPKQKDGADDLEKEIKILPHLKNHITLAIPQFEYIGKQKNGLCFVGYKALPGEILGEDVILSLPEDEKETIAAQLAQFITELSGFPAKQAVEYGVLENDFYKDYTDTFDEVKKIIFPLIADDMKRYISSRYEMYLGCSDNFQYTSALIHADLSPDHYLTSPFERKLTGIIDFGDIEIGDPDYEFLYILEDCGEKFTRRVIELRGLDKVEKRMAKISNFVTFDHIGTILEGVARSNKNWIDNGIKAIRREMK